MLNYIKHVDTIIQNDPLLINQNPKWALALACWCEGLPAVRSLRMLVLPLARLVLRLNTVENGWLKCERDSSESDVGDGNHDDLEGFRIRSQSGSCGTGSNTVSFSGTTFSSGWGGTRGGAEDGCISGVSIMLELLSGVLGSRCSESGWRGVGPKLDGDTGGIGGIWRRGRTAAQCLLFIKSTLWSLLCPLAVLELPLNTF